MDKQERKEKKILTDNRMVTVNMRETSFEGLASKFENGEDGIYGMMTNDKNIIFKPKNKITEEEIAEKLNIATRTLAGIEIGESFVSAQTIENILSFSDISFEDFFISSHLRPTEDLLNDIYSYLDKVKDDREKVENIYKVVKALANE